MRWQQMDLSTTSGCNDLAPPPFLLTTLAGKVPLCMTQSHLVGKVWHLWRELLLKLRYFYLSPNFANTAKVKNNS